MSGAGEGASGAGRIDWVARAMPGIRGLQPYQPGKPVAELERELGIADAVKLASNENPLGPSPLALAAARAVMDGIARYPEGSAPELRQALAARHRLDPAGITVGNGSNDCLDLIARAFLGPGRNAVYAEHAFAVYPISTRAAGAEGRPAPARPDDDPMPRGHDLEAMAQRVDRDTAVVFIANPNNPTGTWLEAPQLRDFLHSLPRHVIAVVDEAYVEYARVPGYASAEPWLGELPNLIVTRTFSKVYGLAGLRVGYALSDPAVADLLNRVRQPFNVNLPGQAAAVAALGDEAHLERSLRCNREGLEALRRGLGDLGLRCLPSAGNFLCVDLGRDAAAVDRGLLERGVIVRPLGPYGLPRHLRITIGTAAENARLLTALEEVLG